MIGEGNVHSMQISYDGEFEIGMALPEVDQPD